MKDTTLTQFQMILSFFFSLFQQVLKHDILMLTTESEVNGGLSCFYAAALSIQDKCFALGDNKNKP